MDAAAGGRWESPPTRWVDQARRGVVAGGDLPRAVGARDGRSRSDRISKDLAQAGPMIVTLHDVAMSRRTGARLRGGLRGSELLLALVVLLGACSESTSPPDLVGPTDVRPDEGARSNECGAADAYVARRSSGVTLMGVDGLTAEACGRSLPGPGAFVAVDATSVLR